MIRATVFALLLATATSVSADVIFLDFDSFTDGTERVYTAGERAGVATTMAGHYAAFGDTFVTTVPVSGDFSTIFFNRGGAGGVAEHIDFRNLDHTDTANVNIHGIISAASSSADWISASAAIGSHELGHLKGLRHGDSFGPPGTGIHAPPGDSPYLPDYPGPVTATITNTIMASPASVGSTIADLLDPNFFNERSATKLAFNDDPNVIAETAAAHGTAATAQAIALATIAVPNTLLSGVNAGKILTASVFAVTGAITTSLQSDYYRIIADAGSVWTFELMSDAIGHRIGDILDTLITVFGPDGVTPVDYYGISAHNDDEFETFDSIIIDLILPTAGPYFIRVNATPFVPTDTGAYELYGYSITASDPPTGGTVPEPASLALMGIAGLGLAGWRLRRRKPVTDMAA